MFISFIFQELYHRILILEKSSRQQLKLERGRVLGLKKKLDLAEQEIKNLKEIIKVFISW